MLQNISRKKLLCITIFTASRNNCSRNNCTTFTSTTFQQYDFQLLIILKQKFFKDEMEALITRISANYNDLLLPVQKMLSVETKNRKNNQSQVADKHSSENLMFWLENILPVYEKVLIVKKFGML